MMSNREKLRSEGRDIHALAMKIVAKSVYGLVAFSAYPGYSPVGASSITGIRRWLLQGMYIVARMAPGVVIVYGDMDSIFLSVTSGHLEHKGREALRDRQVRHGI